MNSKDVIETLNQIIVDQDISEASVARRIGKSSQALNQQLNNSDIKVSKLLEIIEALHCDIDVTITDRANNKKYNIKGE